MNKKAFALLSGGLDSIVAAKVVQEQGVELVGVHFSSIMYADPRKSPKKSAAQYAAEVLGIELITYPKGVEFYHMIQHPKHGYGSAINPCTDCRIYYLRKVKEIMADYGVSFVITGEVLGQRPKSQKMGSLKTIEEESGIAGLLLRPLSAKILQPTLPELDGVVDREKLCAIEGRSRTEQMAIAEKYGIDEYPTPGGGCQLTEKEFMPKVIDMFTYIDYDDNDISLLSLRRHFRMDPHTRIIVSRDQYEGEFLLSRLTGRDVLVMPDGFIGPVAIVRGDVTGPIVNIAAGLVLAYSKSKGSTDAHVTIECQMSAEPDRVQCPVLDDAYIASIKVDLNTMPKNAKSMVQGTEGAV